jgi:hypothetical protein
MSSTFLKNLSDYGVNFLEAQKTDGHPVGKAYDFRAAVAESALHTVVIRAVGLGDGDPSAFYGNDVITAVFAVYSKFLVDPQIHCFYHLALVGDFCMSGGFSGGEKIKTGPKTDSQNECENNNPGSCFHSGTTSCGILK